MRDVVVEETGSDEAGQLAARLRAEGVTVRVAGSAELDADPRADVAYLDCWTPETAPRVVGLRAAGAHVTCLADLVLARATRPVLGVTGTAGKTTTTSFAIQLLRAAGLSVAAPAPGASGNLWPDVSLLQPVEPDLVVCELTSSHLAFCSASPALAVVTSLWPDHVELHGSVDAYVEAKLAIVRHQRPGDVLVVPADGTCERFAEETAADIVRFSLDGPVERGAFLRDAAVWAAWEGGGELAPSPVRGRLAAAVVAAVAVALAAGAEPEALARAIPGLEVPPHRLVEVGRVAGVPILDDSMAATPRKAAAGLELFPDGGVVLVAGGLDETPGGRVHASPEELRALADACALARAKASHVVLFGPAARRLAAELPGAEEAADLSSAVERAAERAGGTGVVLVAPMFPVPAEERARLVSPGPAGPRPGDCCRRT